MPSAFTLKIPASSANLGAGFDCLGLALELYNLIQVEPAPQLTVAIEGEGAHTLARDPRNRVVRAMQLACDALGKPLPSVRLHMRNDIPLARGLGSSAAAVIGGLLISHYWYDAALSECALLKLANQLEGHLDNIAPALLGGLCVVSLDGDKPVALKVPWPDRLRCIVFVPDAPLATTHARDVLPRWVSRADAVFNLGRAALWVAALTQERFDLLALATQDRLHQPYRAKLVKGFNPIVRAALDAGARGAFLSGAGSSIAALADSAHTQIADAMRQAATRAGQRGRVLQLGCDQRGARLD